MIDMIQWTNAQTQSPQSYLCGYCGIHISSNIGYEGRYSEFGQSYTVYIYICHQCYQPTYINEDDQTPGAPFGGKVRDLPMEIEDLYNEISNCAKVSAYTGAVLLCRKLLMNIAVSKGATAGETFVFYVKYLADNGYIPPNAKGWVDHIRNKGNEANHEIVLMEQDDAQNLILLAEMLLKIIYEFPARVPKLLATT